MPVKIEKDNSISISGFSEGIGQSVLSDFSDMMGINVDSNQGIASINYKFNPVIETIAPTTFTVDGAGVTSNIITTAGSLWYRGNAKYLAVTLTTTDTLPAGLAVDTVYYVINQSASTGLYKLASSLANAYAGTPIDITDTGTGTHTINPITPKHIRDWTKNTQGDIFAVDLDNRVWMNETNGVSSVWYLIAGNTSAGVENSGSSIIYYKNYILVYNGGNFDALANIQNPLTESITWTLSFEDVTIGGGDNSPLYLSVNDDSIYFYNGAVTGRYYQIGLLEEVAGQTFDPTSGATFDFVADVTTIPYDYNGIPTAINEIGEYLIIGTGSNKIYFWDKKSPSFTSFIRLQESDVKSIEVIDNIAYIFMNYSGNIYKANTVSSSLAINVPEHITKEYYNYITGVDNYVTNYSTVYKREILFSISILNNDANTVNNYLMSYNIDSKVMTKKNISDYGEQTTRSGGQGGYIYSIFVDDNNLLISTSNYTTDFEYAIESILYNSEILGTPTNYVYDNYEPYIITGLINYGEDYNKKTLRNIQISFARALATGQGIKIYYRLDDYSTWNLIKTVDYATNGAIKDIKVEAPITDIKDLQIKIELAGTGLTTPRLKLIRLIP